MRWLVFASATLIILFLLGVGFAETNASPEKKEIPLKDIWAYRMPGTRDVRDLEPDKFGPHLSKLSSAEQIELTDKSLFSQIGSHLGFNKPGQSAAQSFAVAGTGADALREAAAVMSATKNPRTSMSTSSNVSVLFFSHSFGCYVHLVKVETQPGQIVISYRFVPHETKELTSHFALIPLGKLSPGEVKVDIKRVPIEKTFSDAGFKEPDSSWDSRVVAQSFRFKVKGKAIE
jgi:hypothetical protein